MPYDGTISEALKLAYTGVVTKSSYSYYYATALPTYWSGVGLGGYSKSSTAFSQYNLTTADFLAATATTKSSVLASTAAFHNVANVSFTAGTSTSSDMVVSELSRRLYNDADGNSSNGFQGQEILGFGMPPVASTATTTQKQQASDLFILPGAHATSDTLSRVIQHELSHTLGLKDANATGASLSSFADTGAFTIMSYNAHPTEGRAVKELQLYDIAAAQSVYGRNDAYNSGNTTINSFTETSGENVGHDRVYSIWDGGGTDTINAPASTASLIDLRPGHFSSLGPDANVIVNVTGTSTFHPDVTAGKLNISIAFGAYIENAVGSTKNDLIVGNLLSNSLSGGDGNDVIYGEGLHSPYDAGDGDYSQIINTGTKVAAAPSSISQYVSNKAWQQDVIDGGAGDDYLVGSRGKDTIIGGDGNDKITGGGGKDTIHGGAGDDLIVLNSGYSTVDGGSGANTYWFPKHDVTPDPNAVGQYADGFGTPSYTVEITDFDGADKFVWNGLSANGGALTLIDEEYSNPADTTSSLSYLLVDYDKNGFMYEYDSRSGILDVRFPDGGRVLIDNWVQGTGGLTVTDDASLPYYGFNKAGLDAQNYPTTALVMDGHQSFSDFLTLPEIQASLSHNAIPPMDIFS